MDNSIFIAALAGAIVTFVVSVFLVLSKQIHGKHTLDTKDGVQKFHTTPAPRIGGVAILAGYIASWAFMGGETRTLWALIGLVGLPALVCGLAEDITKKVAVKWRLLATIGSGLLFTLVSGYSITTIDIPALDTLLAIPLVTMVFTAFAIGGVANSINLIDGFHGLASGTLIIILLAFALVGVRVGDVALVTIAVTMLLVVSGFFVVNFPHGKLFLGDAGAYFAGHVVAVLGVMLPARNPEVSPWVSLLILSYPVTETLFSIVRRQRKDGHSPVSPDQEHLHHLVYRAWTLGFANNIHPSRTNNAITSVSIWTLPMMALLVIIFSNLHTEQLLLFLTLGVTVYLIFYRLALLAGRWLAKRGGLE